MTEPSTRVSAQDIAEYYRRNKAKLIVDERRDVRLVVATTRARADAARAALADGQSWKVVARKYSVHVSREKRGNIADVREGSEQTGLPAATGARRLEKKYSVKTTCAPGYRVPRCNTGPKKAGTGV